MIFIVGDVSSLTDARYCAGMNVNYLYFNASASSDSFVNLEKFKEIVQWISGPEVGVMGTLEQDNITAYGTFNVWMPAQPPQQIIDYLAARGGFLVYPQDGHFMGRVNDRIGKLTEVSSKEEMQKAMAEGTDGFIYRSKPEIRPGYQDMDALVECLEFWEELNN